MFFTAPIFCDETDTFIVLKSEYYTHFYSHLWISLSTFSTLIYRAFVVKFTGYSHIYPQNRGKCGFFVDNSHWLHMEKVAEK